MQALDFVRTARRLAESATAGRPLETDLRRAVSTTYYALFHCMAACCADMLVGGAGAARSRPAWRQAYRGLQHRTARRRCEDRIINRFPAEIQDLANLFINMQKKRHRADYDPDPFFSCSRPTVIQDIAETENAIRRFPRADRKDRRAFAVYLLLDIRKD